MLQLTVPNMACAACADTITKAVNAIDPVAKIEADPKTKLVYIETEESADIIKAAIIGAGYAIT